MIGLLIEFDGGGGGRSRHARAGVGNKIAQAAQEQGGLNVHVSMICGGQLIWRFIRLNCSQPMGPVKWLLYGFSGQRNGREASPLAILTTAKHRRVPRTFWKCVFLGTACSIGTGRGAEANTAMSKLGSRRRSSRAGGRGVVRMSCFPSHVFFLVSETAMPGSGMQVGNTGNTVGQEYRALRTWPWGSHGCIGLGSWEIRLKSLALIPGEHLRPSQKPAS